MLGLWWTEGEQIVLSWSAGASRPSSSAGRPGATSRGSSRTAADRWRVVEGRERGELLRAVRDEDGAVTKLYFATYPLTRGAARRSPSASG